MLAERALHRGVRRSAADLERDIRTFVEATNADRKPFLWVKPADNILASVRRFCPRTLGADAPNESLPRTSASGHLGSASKPTGRASQSAYCGKSKPRNITWYAPGVADWATSSRTAKA